MYIWIHNSELTGKAMDRGFEMYMGHIGNAWSQNAARRRADWLCEQASGRVLDVGCSQALLPWLLGHRGLHVTGVDMDGEALNWAKTKLATSTAEAQANIRLVCEDFLNFAPGELFDTIVAGEYLEHLPDDMLDRHLAHMAELLAPGGRLVVTVPLGLHPHPDHEQVFLPRSLSEKLGAHFSLLKMEVEDAYLRCVCDTAATRRTPDDRLLSDLAEKGIIQIQQKADAGKRATKIAELKKAGKLVGDEIALYLRERQAAMPRNALAQKLAARGLAAPFVYDRYLFQTLNELYAETPLVPQPREISPRSLFAQADSRVNYLQKHFGDMAGTNCLEVGCGRGETSVRLAERGRCRVTGVDVNMYPEWPERQSDSVRLVEADLTDDSPFAPESFDYIVSFAVLEHVRKPLAMLDAMFALLKPGGQVYLTANLYRGPMASHRYREVFFPWPHLLFNDDVFMRFYKDRDGRCGVTPAWVNGLTHLHYLERVRKLGFEILKCTYSMRPFDEDFFQCFAEKLERYPREDLEKDFINLMLRKPSK